MHQRKFQIERVLLNIIVQIKLRQAHFCFFVIAFDFFCIWLFAVHFHLFLTNIIVLNCVFCLVLHLHTNCSISLWGNALHYPIPSTHRQTNKPTNKQTQRHVYKRKKHRDTRTQGHVKTEDTKKDIYTNANTHTFTNTSAHRHANTRTRERYHTKTKTEYTILSFASQSILTYLNIFGRGFKKLSLCPLSVKRKFSWLTSNGRS